MLFVLIPVHSLDTTSKCLTRPFSWEHTIRWRKRICDDFLILKSLIYLHDGSQEAASCWQREWTVEYNWTGHFELNTANICEEIGESVAQAGNKFNWLIRQTDSDSAECNLVSDFVLPKSEYFFHCTTYWIFHLKMEFGERKRRRKSQSFKLVTDGGKLLNECKTLQDARLCLGVCLAPCASRDDSVNKSDSHDNAQSVPRF